MTKDEKWQLVADALKKLEDAHAKQDSALKLLNIESDFFESINETEQSLIDVLSALVGDHWQSISWFVYESDFGKCTNKAGVDGNMRDIKTVEDLRWLIEITEGEND